MEEVLERCVDCLLNAWTAYQLAIKMLSGGPDTYEKSEWFAAVLTNYLQHTSKLDFNSLYEWISEILDNEFNLILEDNSVEWITTSLLKCKTWLNDNRKVELEHFLSNLPSQNDVQNATTESKIVDSDSDSDNTNGESSVNMDIRTKLPKRRMETDEDGWTTIIRR
ncbi:unnamed protein product [Thelazia callipaeda]|uniref:Pre-rRNA-processing protein TSR2 homolog n=1 Tax=Thelazia callipaeda TaxID=103827 RepID=A0A0N5CJ89_THECL|nr:unnamed protein product [Thelazia callipaeda]